MEWMDGDTQEPVEPPQTVRGWTPGRPVTVAACPALHWTALHWCRRCPVDTKACRWLPLAVADVAVVLWVGFGFSQACRCVVRARAGEAGQGEVAGTPYMCVMDVTGGAAKGSDGSGTAAHGSHSAPSLGCHLASIWCSRHVPYTFVSFPPCCPDPGPVLLQAGLVRLSWLSPKQNSRHKLRLLVPVNWWCRLPGRVCRRLECFELTRRIITLSSNSAVKGKTVIALLNRHLAGDSFFVPSFAFLFMQSLMHRIRWSNNDEQLTDSGRRRCLHLRYETQTPSLFLNAEYPPQG